MDFADFRQDAIERLMKSAPKSFESNRTSPAELLRELHIHQMELELQNEELRRLHVELARARDGFAQLFEFAPVGYLTLDANDRVIEANLALDDLLGVEHGGLVGKTLGEYVVPEDAVRLMDHLRDIDTAVESINCDLTLKCAKGEPKPVRLHSSTVADGEGGRRRFIAMLDRSKKAVIIRAKQDSDERLRVICHALPIPIAYIDQTETYQFNNAAHESWFKFSRGLIMGRHVKEVLGSEIYELVKSRIEQALAGHACSCRLELAVEELGPRTVEAHYAPYRDADNVVTGLYELMIDVSANRRIEEEQAAREKLESQLASLSHRQRQVFDLLVAGKPNKFIAHSLDLGMRTVERVRHDILDLLGADSIGEMLVKYAGLADSNSRKDGA